jgi:thiosulfate dehydrogenase [quinone] large subunit
MAKRDDLEDIIADRQEAIMPQTRNQLYSWAGIAISVIAGAWTLFHIVWDTQKQTADDYWGQALLVLFILALALAFLRYFQERPALLATTPNEEFPEPSISRFFLGSSGAAALWFVVRMNVGAQWLLAGWEKAQSPAWGSSGVALKGFVAGALAKTGGANPAVQGWYADFLKNFVLPNAGFYSFLVTWGEVAVGLGLLVGALTGIAAGFGVLMNLNYLLAGTVSINPIIGTFGLFLCFAWRVAGYYGLDYWLLPALGLPWKPGTAFHQTQAGGAATA